MNAEDLPQYQSSRGNEFRDVPVEERQSMARIITRARSQMWAEHADWEDVTYLSQLARKRAQFAYEAGRLGISRDEANIIWSNTVYEGLSPHQQRDLP